MKGYTGRKEILLSAGISLDLGTQPRTGDGKGCQEEHAHNEEPKGDAMPLRSQQRWVEGQAQRPTEGRRKECSALQNAKASHWEPACLSDHKARMGAANRTGPFKLGCE